TRTALMLRTWWANRNKTRSGKATQRQDRRKVNLGVEYLEAREVMSATVPGFTLVGSNLYSTAHSQHKLIDTGVKAYAVGNGKPDDVHTDGTLHTLRADGSGNKTLDTNVVKYATAASGNFLTLDGRGNLFSSGALWQANTQDFAVTSNGTFYCLGNHISHY